ncbi:MAG: sigma-70 family RNA polymerase sigma factor, partial [Deltaproteobacteria bacterium]
MSNSSNPIALHRAPANDERPRRPVPAANPLATYLGELAEHTVMTPDEERHLAREIERRDIAAWEALLSYRPHVRGLLAELERRLGDASPSFAALRRADTLARKSRGRAPRARYDRAVQQVAALLRHADRDREAFDALVAGVDRLAARRRDRGFAAYAERVRRARAAADAARREFVERNLRLVVTMARKFAASGAMPLPDLIQEGNIGLIKAVDRFDYRKGFRFSTYACWWIRHHIGRAIADKSRAVRRPVHVLDTAHRLARVSQELRLQLGRDPTVDEIADAAGETPQRVRDTWQRVAGAEVSLDEPVGEDGTRTRLELLPDEDARDPDATVAERERAAALRERLRGLSAQEADIVRRRFGFDGGREYTLQEIANDYGLSRERIRQIEARA